MLNNEGYINTEPLNLKGWTKTRKESPKIRNVLLLLARKPLSRKELINITTFPEKTIDGILSVLKKEYTIKKTNEKYELNIPLTFYEKEMLDAINKQLKIKGTDFYKHYSEDDLKAIAKEMILYIEELKSDKSWLKWQRELDLKESTTVIVD